MYISMPKDFYVPVVFSDEFIYNEETNQVEYDSNRIERYELSKDLKVVEDKEEYTLDDISELYEKISNVSRKLKCEDALDFHLKHIRKIISSHIEDVKCFESLKDKRNDALVAHILDDHENRFKGVFQSHLNMFNCCDTGKPINVEAYIEEKDIKHKDNIYALIDDEYVDETVNKIIN